MNNKLILLFLIFFGISNTEIKAQCTKAEAYVTKVKAAENWTPTERVKSGSKVQGWTQLGTWHAYKCECDKGGRTAQEAENLKNGLNQIRQTIVSQYSDAGEIPPIITKCKSGNNSNATNNLNNNKSSFQIEMENRFNNYNKAMSLKTQGENIAKAFAEQVKQFGNLNNASNPQELLNNFNQNMSQIAQLQAQNRSDNLNQIDATLGSALNHLNNGNGEGALFSALSLIDQSYEQKQAKKEAEYQKQKLVQQHKQQMSQFYWKAVDLNNNAINSYYKNAAYAFSSQNEQYYLDFVAHHECFKTNMKNNFSFSNTNWTINNCEVPKKSQTIENNLTAKEVQYKNTASRKYKLYEETGIDDFKQAAIRFAGMTVIEKPSAENYYLLGHYAGIEEPITAFIAFRTAQEIDPNYFNSDKQGKYFLIENAIESTFKEAIIDNNLEFIKSAIGADLHKIVQIESNSAIVFAIQQDKPDVVQLFLNDLTNGKTQQQISTKVNEVILMASTLDAPKTIQRFIDLGFSVDFEIKGLTPIEIALESKSLKVFFILAKSVNISSIKNSSVPIVKAFQTYNYLYQGNEFEANNSFMAIYDIDVKSALVLILLNDINIIRDENKLVNIFSLNISKEVTSKIKDNEAVKVAFFNALKFNFPTKPSDFIKHKLLSIDKNGNLPEAIAHQYMLWNFNNDLSSLENWKIKDRTKTLRNLFEIAIYYRQDEEMIKELLRNNYVYESYNLSYRKEYKAWQAMKNRSETTKKIMNSSIKGEKLYNLLNLIIESNQYQPISNPCSLLEDLMYDIVYFNEGRDIEYIRSEQDYEAGKKLILSLIDKGVKCDRKLFKTWRSPPFTFMNISYEDRALWKKIRAAKY
ncbi:hypothetical protein [Polaribacter sp.]|uniref:hypothetical protein n=1 Tax=Polaribacter sp. TaxID=1920175 RepID=UPI003F6B402E